MKGEVMEIENNKACKTVGKRVRIEGAYTPELARDFTKLGDHLGIPSSILNKWRRCDEPGSGWLSYPVTREDYATLLIIANFYWGNQQLIRTQLSRFSKPRREYLIRGAGLSWIERVVLEDVLRRKLLGEKRYVQWDWYRKWLRGRYPHGYQQLTGAILRRTVKKASDMIRYAKSKNRLRDLAESLGLVVDAENNIQPRGHAQSEIHQYANGHEKSNETMLEEIECFKNDLSAEEEQKNDVKDSVEVQQNQISFYEWSEQFRYSPILAKLNLNERIKNLKDEQEETPQTE